jgi:carboxylesterase
MSRIMSGAEPFYFPGDSIGCLLVHGFTATPQEVRELGEFLRGKGHTILGIRLTGHATDWRDLARSRWTDWLASVEDGYQLLHEQCEHIIPIGLSTGSVLNLILASEINFPAVVAMATPVDLPAILALRLLYPILRPLSFFLPYIKKGKPDWRDPQALAARLQYDCYPLRAVYEFGQCVYKLQEVLPKITSPLLLLHSSEDKFVLPEHSERIAASAASEQVEVRFVKNSNHVISSDAARHEVFQITADFIAKILNLNAD